MSTPEDEQYEAAFEFWNETTNDHPDVTSPDEEELAALLEAEDNSSFKTSAQQRRYARDYYHRKYHPQGQTKCRWCGLWVDAPNEYHDNCLEVKNRLRRYDGRE